MLIVQHDIQNEKANKMTNFQLSESLWVNVPLIFFTLVNLSKVKKLKNVSGQKKLIILIII